MTTKQLILNYLNDKIWVSGSELENQARDWQTKASTISRRCRELADEGKIIRELSFGKHKTVQYRIAKGGMTASEANIFLKGLPEGQVQGSLL